MPIRHTETSRQPSTLGAPPPLRIFGLGCPVLVVLLTLGGGCTTETSDAAQSSYRMAFLGNAETPAQVNLTLRDISRPADAILGASTPTENVALEVKDGSGVNVEADAEGRVTMFELVSSTLNGNFEDVTLDEALGSYRVRGLGWLDASVLLAAVNTTFADPEYDYFPNLALCNAAEGPQGVLTELTFDVVFLGASGQRSALEDAASVRVDYRGASVQSSVICGLTFEEGTRTEVQIELSGGFDAHFSDPAAGN